METQLIEGTKGRTRCAGHNVYLEGGQSNTWDLTLNWGLFNANSTKRAVRSYIRYVLKLGA